MEDTIIPITPDTPIPAEAEEGPFVADEEFEVHTLEVQSSAVGSLKAEEAGVVSSAVGVVSATGDVSIDSSFAGAVLAGGAVDMTQAGSIDVLTKGDVSMHQAGTVVLLSGRDVTIDTGGAGVSMARTTTVRNGWVGFLLSGRTELSDDSRVILDAKAAAVFGLVFGGIMILAFGGLAGWGWWRYRQWRATWPQMPRMPHLPQMSQMPHLPHMPHMEMPRMPWRRDAA